MNEQCMICGEYLLSDRVGAYCENKNHIGSYYNNGVYYFIRRPINNYGIKIVFISNNDATKLGRYTKSNALIARPDSELLLMPEEQFKEKIKNYINLL